MRHQAREQIEFTTRRTILQAFLSGLAACVAAGAAFGGGSAAGGGGFCFDSTPYAVEQSPSCVVAADLNGDGLADLVAANHEVGTDTVSVLMNNGDGTFAPQAVYAAGARPYWLGAADLDGDGDIDIAVTNYWGHSVSIYLNDGTGALSPHTEYLVEFFPTFLALADVDNDGDLDVAAANAVSYSVSVIRNNGDGTFGRAESYPVVENPYGVTAGDFNNDGFVDLAVANHSDDFPVVSVLLNNGDGTFAEQALYPVPHGPIGLDHADLDHDGDLDLAVASPGVLADSNIVAVMLGDGDGTFAAGVEYVADYGPYSLILQDITDDGNDDMVCANQGPGGVGGDVSVFIGNGDGTFGPQTAYPAGFSPLSVIAADLDGNSTPELATAAYGGYDLYVLFNQYPAITQDPQAIRVEEGQPAAFTVAVSGPGPFTYQWRFNGADLADGGAVGGATTDTLTIDPSSSADAGLYDVVIGNACGILVSAGAELSITPPPDTCPADLDGDGDVDIDDLFTVINGWGACAARPCVGDVDRNSHVDIDDLFTVINNWGACP